MVPRVGFPVNAGLCTVSPSSRTSFGVKRRSNWMRKVTVSIRTTSRMRTPPRVISEPVANEV
jgi:hypothetical protein